MYILNASYAIDITWEDIKREKDMKHFTWWNDLTRDGSRIKRAIKNSIIPR